MLGVRFDRHAGCDKHVQSCTVIREMIFFTSRNWPVIHLQAHTHYETMIMASVCIAVNASLTAHC